MQYTDTYPVPMEQERLAVALGLFRPVATPTDAQRMEAAQKVEGREVLKRTAYWMHLEQIIKRDNPQPQKHPKKWKITRRAGGYTTHYGKRSQRRKNKYKTATIKTK